MAIRTLEDVRAFVRERAASLDPQSRYIRELLERVDRAKDVAELASDLDRGCRGRLHAGDDTWARMTFEERLQSNLVTNETQLMRFEPAEVAYLHEAVLPWLRGTQARVASVPCSHGLEPVSLAIEMLEAGISFFHIAGFDVQRACIETAMSGRIPVIGLPRYVTAHVEPKVMNHLSFYQLDVLRESIPGQFDLVVCRNFLGYWKPEIARGIVEKMLATLAAPGCLMVEAFITRKHPAVFEGLGLRRVGELPVFWRDGRA